MKQAALERLGFSFVVAVVLASVATAQEPNRPSSPPRAIEDVFQEEFDQVLHGEVDQSALLKHRAAVKDAVLAIGSSDETVRFDAELLLQRLVQKTDLPSLLPYLREYAIRPEAMVPLVRVIGSIGDRRAVDPLRKEFELSEKQVQLAIVDALGTIKDETVVPLLSNLLRSTSDTDFIFRGLSALARIGDPRAIYAIESSFRLLPEGAPQLAAKWALDVAKGVVRQDYTDTIFQPGRKSLLFYQGQLFFYYRPTTLHRDTADPWLLVCVHGTALNVEAVFDQCAQAVKEDRLAVLAPFFDPVFFPDYSNLNLRQIRSDRRLFELVDFLAEKTQVRKERFYLFGYERGGEFAQRLTLAYPERIARAAFATTSYQSIDESKQYPLGLIPSPAVPDLKFALDSIVRTEFAPIVDQVQQSAKPFKLFMAGLDAAADRRSLLPAYRTIVVDSKQLDLVNAVKAAHAFLFPPKELKPLAVQPTGYPATFGQPVPR